MLQQQENDQLFFCKIFKFFDFFVIFLGFYVKRKYDANSTTKRVLPPQAWTLPCPQGRQEKFQTREGSNAKDTRKWNLFVIFLWFSDFFFEILGLKESKRQCNTIK